MGGGGGGQNTVTTQVEKLPVELVPFYQDLLGRGVYESLTGYETYPFRRLADFDPYEGGAHEAYAEMALAGTPESFRESQQATREVMAGSPYQRAVQADEVTQELARQFGEYAVNRPEFKDLDMADKDFTKQALQDDYLLAEGDLKGFDDAAIGNLKSLQGEAVGDVSVAGFGDEGILESYMNPYQQEFIDRQKRLAREESAGAASEIGQQAALAGGLGGYREAVMQSERERNLANQLQDIQARGDLENYMQARQAFEADRAADYTADVANRQAAYQFGEADRQAALQFGEADRQAAFQDIGQARQQFEQDRLADMQRAEFNRRGLAEQAEIAQRGYQTLGGDIDRRLAAAQQGAGLAGTRQAMEFDRLGQLEAAGARRRGLAQQGLDIGYQDFLRQQAFPREQLNLYSGLLRGVPVGPGQYKSSYGEQPSGFQTALGTGLGALGLYGATGGWGGGGGNWGGST